jgi:hypothetical protein
MDAKIRLSPKEVRLSRNSEIILTKNALLQKIKDGFAELQEDYLSFVSKSGLTNLPAPHTPKISRGENYKGLPWIILDYPRHFDKQNVFAIRTMFWWGHFFSITLHLTGAYKKEAEKKLIADFSSLKKREFSICVNEKQWEHHFQKDNYRSLKKLGKKKFEELLSQRSFMKLARNIPVKKWEDATAFLFRDFKLLIKCVLA